MIRSLAVAALATLLLASPGSATTFNIFESSLGAPDVTANFPYGSAQIANIDFDADSAENGGLAFGGPSEVTIVAAGTLVFTDFTCEAGGCTDGVDYVFTPGGAGTGELVWHDPNFNAQTGIVDLGLLEFDILSGLGSMELTGCNYTGGDAVERACDPFTLVSVPEPGTGALLSLGLLGVAQSRRRRS